MSSEYPLLTVKNLRYWYWECEPGYSLLDIVKVTGASYSRVQRFMEKHEIPRRDKSEAGKNRFECEFKKEAFLETVQSEEHRERQSIIGKRLWLDPKKRKKMQDIALKKLSEKQIKILYLASRINGLFQAKVVPVLKKDKGNISTVLKVLFERGLLNREKQKNVNTESFRTFQFKYFITEDGTKILNSYLSRMNSTDKEEMNALASLYNKLKKEMANLSFGENQEMLLKIIKEHGSMFASDFYDLVTLNNRAIGKSLSGLASRGVLIRTRKRNPNSLRDNPYQYKYKLSDFGEKLLTTRDIHDFPD